MGKSRVLVTGRDSWTGHLLSTCIHWLSVTHGNGVFVAAVVALKNAINSTGAAFGLERERFSSVDPAHGTTGRSHPELVVAPPWRSPLTLGGNLSGRAEVPAPCQTLSTPPQHDRLLEALSGGTNDRPWHSLWSIGDSSWLPRR